MALQQKSVDTMVGPTGRRLIATPARAWCRSEKRYRSAVGATVVERINTGPSDLGIIG